MIDEFFDSEENAQPILQSTATIPSVNQLNVASNQKAASARVDTTPASQPISPATPSDQQQLINSGEVQVNDKPIEEGSSTRSREDKANTNESTVNVSSTGQHHQPAAANNQRALVLYTGPPAQAFFGDAPANQLVPFEEDYYSDDLESIKSEVYSDEEPPISEEEMDSEPNDEEDNLSNISVKSEDISDWENEEEDEEIVFAIEGIPNNIGNMLAIEGIPHTEDTGAHGSQEANTANDQVDNSLDINFEERDDSQAMELNDDVDEQPSDAETIIDEDLAREANNSEPVQAIPTVDFISLPSTSTGRRRSTRTKKKVNYASTHFDDSFARKRVNSIRKNKPVLVESESSESSDEEEFVGQQNTIKRKVSTSGTTTKKAKHSRTQSAVAASAGTSQPGEPLKVITKRLNCPQDGCNTVCKDKTSLNVHLLVKHAIEKYRCLIADCTASFEHQIQMTDHLDGHGNLSDWPCGKCSSSFTSYTRLLKHHYHQHQEGLFECSVDDCDFKEITRNKVYHHQDCHRTPKHICSVDNCGRSFVKKSDFDRHLRAHTQERTFACEECGKSFSQQSTLIVHLRSHSGTMKARCTWPECAYQATTTSDVVKHIRCVHFKLPQSRTDQLQLGIVDDRDARVYLEKI